jgi:hypothetical protein
MPRWMRAVQKAILAQPGITALPRCQACARLMAPADMRSDDLCRDCHTERSMAWDDDGPFLPSDEDD